MLIDSFVHRLGGDRVRRLDRARQPYSRTGGGIALAHAGPAPPQQKPLTGPRPFLLLPKPELAEVLALLPEGPPRRFRWRGVMRNVAQADGPERIAGEWWRNREAQARSRARLLRRRGRDRAIASGSIAKACRIAKRICRAGSCMASLPESMP